MQLDYYFWKIKEFKKKSYSYLLKRVVLFVFYQIKTWIMRKKAIIEIKYGFLPYIKRKFSHHDSGLLKIPQSELVEKVRYFWYSNIPGEFDLDGEKISRKEIFLYGGPDPFFKCPICQRSEWLSRVRQKNLFIFHSCPESERCQLLCNRQGNELWTHYHQNFNFTIGCDPNLPAPKRLEIRPIEKGMLKEKHWKYILEPCCEQGNRVSRRKFAQTCQNDYVIDPNNIKWSNYDFLMMTNSGNNPKFSRPNLPIILFCHDFWAGSGNYQWVIDWLKPDILLTPYPTQWKEYFRLPSKTKVILSPFSASTFFTRPNLEKKELDLLVVGSITSSVCAPRLFLAK